MTLKNGRLVEAIAQWLHENGYVYRDGALDPVLTLERQADLMEFLKNKRENNESSS